MTEKELQDAADRVIRKTNAELYVTTTPPQDRFEGPFVILVRAILREVLTVEENDNDAR